MLLNHHAAAKADMHCQKKWHDSAGVSVVLSMPLSVPAQLPETQCCSISVALAMSTAHEFLPAGAQFYVHMQDRRNALAGIDILRKICNHPDLLQRRQWESSDKYGDPVRSGKLVVALKVRAPLLRQQSTCQPLLLASCRSLAVLHLSHLCGLPFLMLPWSLAGASVLLPCGGGWTILLGKCCAALLKGEAVQMVSVLVAGGWQVLHHWKKQGHKALVFTQTQQMLDIMERVIEAAGFRLGKQQLRTTFHISVANSQNVTGLAVAQQDRAMARADQSLL
jgi:SNF2 family DNA or RNA helicase